MKNRVGLSAFLRCVLSLPAGLFPIFAWASADSQVSLVPKFQEGMSEVASWWGALETFLGYLHSIWHYSLFTIDEHRIELASVLITIFVLYVGIKLAGYLSDLVSRGLTNYTDLEESAIDACSKIAYYIFLVLIALQALAVAHIPLTVFAFVGGALAIGVGFGSQNIINNFISGLIIMVERPIRIGDVIDIHNTFGRVINIGARCTHIRQVSNIDILIPNSYVLENKIINWTLNGNHARISVPIRVSLEHNTNTKAVEGLLSRAISMTEEIVSDPESSIFLLSFDDGVANFEVHFWINAKDRHERRYITSQLNHKIAAVFAEENIEFAIPYRKIISS